MSNVINLFGNKKNQPKKAGQEDSNVLFEEIMKANKEKEQRLKEERKKKNSQVTRSYRLKK